MSISTSSTPVIDVYSICSDPAHYIYDCPTVHQFSEFIYEQVNQVQTQNNFRLGYNLFSNTYNLDWKNHPNFSWAQQPIVRPLVPRPNYTKGAYKSVPCPQQGQNSQSSSNAALEKILEELQILHSHTQSIEKLEA